MTTKVSTLLEFLFGLALAVSIPFSEPSQAAPSTLEGQTVTLCGEDGEWPPYHYYKREKGKKTREIVGYDLDLVREILSKNGIRTVFKMLPWKRCLAEVEEGEETQVAMSATFSEERAKKFLYTKPHYVIRPFYFYDQKRFPDGHDIQGPADLLKRGRYCGVHGHSYESLGGGIKNANLNLQPKTYGALVKMIKAGRCELFSEYIEIIAGFASTGEDFFADGRLGFKPIPQTKKNPFYLLISKNYAQGEELKRILDAGITKMKISGKLRELIGKYVPE